MNYSRRKAQPLPPLDLRVTHPVSRVGRENEGPHEQMGMRGAVLVRFPHRDPGAPTVGLGQAGCAGGWGPHGWGGTEVPCGVSRCPRLCWGDRWRGGSGWGQTRGSADARELQSLKY